MNEILFLDIFSLWDLVLALGFAILTAFFIHKAGNFIDKTVETFYKKHGPKELNLETVPWRDPITETEQTYCFRDGYPVTQGHLLYVPKYNTPEAIALCFIEAYGFGNSLLELGSIDGFNIGLNQGVAAGQTVNWPHIHLIPRKAGDSEDPTGGIRNVIPKQGNYKSSSYELPK